VSFFNDIAAAPDGRIFVSDSGLKQGATDFEPTGSDAIWQVKNAKLEPYYKSEELMRPNGLYWTKDGLAFNGFGGNKVRVINDAALNPPKAGKGQAVPKMALYIHSAETPKGGLDGLWADETSGWEGSAIYKGSFDGKVATPILEGLSAPADFAIDEKRKRIIVPRFMTNKVEAYDLK
jgi:hypothetical protein